MIANLYINNQVIDSGVASGSIGVYAGIRDNIASSVPDPGSDLIDWYWLQPFAVSGADRNFQKWAVDIRTARKIRGEDRTMGLVVEGAAGQAAFHFEFDARLLLMPG